MANKIINLKSSKIPEVKEKLYPNETYLDISMALVGNPDDRFQIDEKNKNLVIGRNTDEMAVANSIYNIFTWIPGERILDPEFGDKLRRHLYEGITDNNIEGVISEIQHALNSYDPRVKVSKIYAEPAEMYENENKVVINIEYEIADLDHSQRIYSYILEKNI